MHIITPELLQDIIDNLQQLTINFAPEKQSNLCSFIKFTLVFKDKQLTDSLFILKNAKCLKYHKEYSKGTIIINAEQTYELNVIKLLNHIIDIVKQHYQTNQYYNSVNDEHHSFKLDIPKMNNKYIINKTHYNTDDTDSLCELFNSCTVSAYYSINQICKKNKQFISIKPKATHMVVKQIEPILSLDEL